MLPLQKYFFSKNKAKCAKASSPFQKYFIAKFLLIFAF